MRWSSSLAAVVCSVVASTLDIELPVGVPRSIVEFRQKHPYQSRAISHCRRTVKIRSSSNDADDISDEFLAGIKQANEGGTLYLPKDELFIIGKPLDLTFLNDIHVRIDGEIKVYLL